MSLPAPVEEGICSLKNILFLHPQLMAIVVIVNTEPERQGAESEQVWPCGNMVGSYLPLLLHTHALTYADIAYWLHGWLLRTPPPTYPSSYLSRFGILTTRSDPTYPSSYLPILLLIQVWHTD